MVRPSAAAIPSMPPRSRAIPRDSSSPDSPSKNMWSRTQVSESQATLPVLVSPTKRCKKGKPDNDLAVWDKSDEEIIGVYLTYYINHPKSNCRGSGRAEEVEIRCLQSLQSVARTDYNTYR
jgi:hypothetical protein